MPPKIVISFDFELGWGVLENRGWKELEERGVYKKMREDIPRILSLLKKHSIKTTWAIVGGMLNPESTGASLEHLPNDYQKSVKLFLSESETETNNGRDLIDQVVAMGNLCEIGSHTSTHIYANHTSVSEQQYVSDVVQSFVTLKKYTGRKVNTLIFPRDQAEHRLAVAKCFPFLNMRLNPMMGTRTNKSKRCIQFLTDFISQIPQSRINVGQYAEVYHFGSMYFNMMGNKFRKARTKLLRLRTKKLLNQLYNCNDNRVFHIWLHPFNLSETGVNLTLFCSLIEEIGRLQLLNRVASVSMKDLGSI
jgi:peptidoglycan/xylan/chitin deacetylase (PgdA/CDA1 family)